MNRRNLLRALSLLLVLCLAAVPGLAWAAGEGGGDARTGSGATALGGLHRLTPALQAQVKSLYAESPGNETEIGAVVRIYNTSGRYVRLSDMMIYAVASDGNVYELSGSAANALTIRPHAREELSFMAVLEGQLQLDITELRLVEVDEYVYPKQETVLLSLPVASQDVWRGRAAASPNRLDWNQPFQLPETDSPLTFVPAGCEWTNASDGSRYLLTFLVKNTTELEQKVPAFAVDGLTASTPVEVFTGKRTEQGDIRIQPHDEQYIHYSIPVDAGKRLSSANILTTETYYERTAAGTAGQARAYSIGRATLDLKDGSIPVASASAYTLGTPIALDPNSHYIHQDLAVSLVELNTHDGEDDGYRTVIGKFQLTNNGLKPIAVPAFQTELADAQGHSYSGSRQSEAAEWVMPGTSRIISYAFLLPETEEKDAGALYNVKLLDPQSAAPMNVTMAEFPAQAAPPVLASTAKDLSALNFYPYTIRIQDWNLSAYANLSSITLAPVTETYRLKLDLELTHKPNVIVDKTFSKLEFDLLDTAGKILSTRFIPFTGTNGLIDGSQYIVFDQLRINEQAYPLSVKIYETFDTPAGPAKRLVAVLAQGVNDILEPQAGSRSGSSSTEQPTGNEQ